LVSYEFAIIENVIRDMFSSKGNDVVTHNIELARAGYDYVAANYNDIVQKFPNKLKSLGKNKEHILLTGNEACSLGALAAGCKFVSIYPMTPISTILSLMQYYGKKFNVVVKQPEDEISAVNMAVGAWHAGVRALTATSGGGFCLMVEGLGLAAMTETPLVIINGMRGGPSTGLPTWTEQSDLQFALHASHGDFPRIVIAPGDVEDAFYLIIDAFNLAERYQLVVIVLTDKQLNESHKSIQKFDLDAIKIERGKFLTDKELEKVVAASKEYKRYLFVEDGVSPRVLPGQENGVFTASSDEHTEYGMFSEDSENRIKMMQKRFKKLETAAADIPQPKLYGEKDAEFTLISFGSTKGAILEAMQFLKCKGIKTNFMQIICLNPFPAEKVISLIKSAKNVICVECNFTGQLAALIREKTGIEIKNNLRKYDGRPFYPEEIYEYVLTF
jgi:2-oxoglutarate ferredoxin oxidoreductase subunit alpha